jgi:hypothetical protein
MLCKDVTITAPVTAPKIKLIHIDARIWVARRTDSFEESSLGFLGERCFEAMGVPNLNAQSPSER